MSSFSPTELRYMQSHIGDNRSGQIYATNVVCALAAYIAVLLRLIARSLTTAKYGRDDWLIAAGLILFTGYIISSSLTTRYGMGRHIILVTNAKDLTTTLMATECLYNSTIPVIKVSILCFYRRIFPQRWFKHTLIGLGLFVIGYGIAQLFGDIFQCVPLKKMWIPTVSGRCINFEALIIAGGVINIITDFVILGLPMPLLWHLEIPTRKKRLLSIVFSIGGCACIASIVRLYYAQAISSADTTYNDIGGLITSSVECSGGIISACIPTFGPLVSRVARGHTNASSTRWPSRRGQKEEQHVKMSNTAKVSSKGWFNIAATSDVAEGEEVMQLYERA